MTWARVKLPLGIVCMALPIAWVFIAPCLSAWQNISFITESLPWLVCLPLVAIGTYLYGPKRKDGLAPHVRLKRNVVCVLAVLAVVLAMVFSNSMFFFWKCRVTTQNKWTQMASDLTALGEEVSKDESGNLREKKAVPKSLRQLGAGQDYNGVNTQRLGPTESSELLANIMFGNRARSWGLFIGPENFLNRWCPGNHRVRVSTNAFFYVGSKG